MLTSRKSWWLKGQNLERDEESGHLIHKSVGILIQGSPEAQGHHPQRSPPHPKDRILTKALLEVVTREGCKDSDPTLHHSQALPSSPKGLFRRGDESPAQWVTTSRRLQTLQEKVLCHLKKGSQERLFLQVLTSSGTLSQHLGPEASEELSMHTQSLRPSISPGSRDRVGQIRGTSCGAVEMRNRTFFTSTRSSSQGCEAGSRL